MNGILLRTMVVGWTLAAMFAWAAPSAMAQEQEGAAAPPEPVAATGGVRDILVLRAFMLEEPYRYTFTSEQPEIRGGWIAVLEVDPQLVVPRETDVPVLFAGDTPAHLTNVGYPSGRMIVILPGRIDPGAAPFYFGSMDLPERIDAARGATELAAAVVEGAVPFPAPRIAAAREAGGAPARLRDGVALFLVVADLIDAYAPDEADLASIYRTPVVGR